MRIDTQQIKTLVAAAVILVVYGLGVWLPRSVSASRLKDRVEQAKATLDAMPTTDAGQLTALSDQVEHLREVANREGKTVPDRTDIASLLRSLGECLSAESASDPSIRTQSITRGSTYSVIPIELTFAGSSATVFGVLERIEDLPRLLRLTRFDVEPQRDGAGRLRASIQLSAFSTEHETMAEVTR